MPHPTALRDNRPARGSAANFLRDSITATSDLSFVSVELNIIVDSTRDRTDLLAWFDELWNDRNLVADVKEEVLRHLARLYGNQSPQFIYYLTLFHVFREFLKQNRDAELQLDKTNFFDSLVWKKLYGFQRDGVRGAIRKLLDHNGCILADSVGLGKTFEALAVIKYFEMVKGARVLVLCPKKLGDNWLKWLSPGQRNTLAGDKFNYDVLSHTDLSRARGQVGRVNLADISANYDIHWNPVRIIQRFGRIDRIGSRHHNVRLVNFWPTEDLDAYLKVKQRVEARMALVDLTASGEDNLLNTEQIEDLIKADLHYRNKQLLKLKDEVLDLEDFNEESVTLTDFSLDDFRLDLLQFLEANRKELEEAEPGLYAVVAPDPQIPKSQPGVIFCLRQKVLLGEPVSANSEKLNPTHPHFLVYVLDSGDVRFSFAAPKQILQIFRELAAGQATADEKLCDLFDARTKDGADMSHYAGLARKALESIRRTFARRAASSLLSSRDGLLPLASEQPADDDSEFELLTWLVIQPPAQ